jgi:hypothetical protein
MVIRLDFTRSRDSVARTIAHGSARCPASMLAGYTGLDTEILVRQRSPHDARILDRLAHHFVERFLDHHLFAGVAADHRVRRRFDVANFLGIQHKLLPVKPCKCDHDLLIGPTTPNPLVPD